MSANLDTDGTFFFRTILQLPKDTKVLGSMRGKYDFVTGDTGTTLFSASIEEFFHILP